ncbi:MAG: hypothetical protein QXO47_05760 [Thermoproteota archaeon]|nr:hypothetical protein [Candidatus Brockarchaeota archaeon]
MAWKKAIYAPVICVLMILSLTPVAIPLSPNPEESGNLAEKAGRILSVTESAKNAVQRLITYVEENETATALIEKMGLMDDFEGNITRFEDGVSILEDARGSFEKGNYEDAISKAMEVLAIFREVFRNINRILCSAKIKSHEIMDGQGLIVAMNTALNRVERLEKLAEALNEKGVDVSDVMGLLNQARGKLNIDEARKLIEQGDVSTVARNLAEANRLIAEASRILNAKNRRLIAERIKQYLERLRAKVRERLREMGVTEEELFRGWNFEEFWSTQWEALERIRSRIEERRFNDILSDLRELGRKINEFRHELEFRIQQRKGTPGPKQGNKP